MATGLDRRPVSGVSDNHDIIQIGATTTELCAMFGTERRDIRSRLAGIPPTGTRDGLPTWKVGAVASRLVPFDEKDAVTIARILATHPHQLPKLLAKEFWMGQKHRLDVLMRVGGLWDTQAVVELAGAAFKTIRLTFMLVADTLDRETNLTAQQRQLVADTMASLLEDMRQKLVTEMDERRQNTRGKKFMAGLEDMLAGLPTDYDAILDGEEDDDDNHGL